MVMKRNHTLRWACLFKARRVSTSMAVVFLTAGISLMVMLPWGVTPVAGAGGDYPRRNQHPSSVEEMRHPDGAVL